MKPPGIFRDEPQVAHRYVQEPGEGRLEGRGLVTGLVLYFCFGICVHAAYTSHFGVAILTETGFTNVEYRPLELSKFASVEAFSDCFEKDGGNLDILVQTPL